MERAVSGECTLSEGETLTLELCNRYGYSLGGETVNVTVGSGGAFSVSLAVNAPGECWVAVNNTPRRAFWVYGGKDGTAQSVVLREPVLPRGSAPVIEGAAGREAALNVDVLMRDIACGVPVVCEEEQRFLCRYDAYMDGEEDMVVCEIDTKLGGEDG